MAGGVEDAQDLHGVAAGAHPVHHEARHTGDDQLAGVGFPSGAAGGGKASVARIPAKGGLEAKRDPPYD
jgi:hypothetical protein